jgi:hypothetical protein
MAESARSERAERPRKEWAQKQKGRNRVARSFTHTYCNKVEGYMQITITGTEMAFLGQVATEHRLPNTVNDSLARPRGSA